MEEKKYRIVKSYTLADINPNIEYDVQSWEKEYEWIHCASFDSYDYALDYVDFLMKNGGNEEVLWEVHVPQKDVE